MHVIAHGERARPVSGVSLKAKCLSLQENEMLVHLEFNRVAFLVTHRTCTERVFVPGEWILRTVQKFRWTHSTRIADRVFVPREWIAFQIFPRTHSPRIARMFVHLFKGKPWRVTHPENFGIGTRESI